MLSPCLPAIPPEIVDLILHNIKEKRDLLNFGCTCKDLFRRVVPLLYTDVTLCRSYRPCPPDEAYNLFDPVFTVLRILGPDAVKRSTTAKLMAESLPSTKGVGHFVQTLKIDSSREIVDSQFSETIVRMNYIIPEYEEEYDGRKDEGMDEWMEDVKRIQGDYDAENNYKIPDALRERYIRVFNRMLRDALGSMTNLKRFSIGPVSELENKTMKTIQQTTTTGNLTEVEVDFPEYMHRYRNGEYEYEDGDHRGQFHFHDDFCHILFVGFGNLTSFKVWNLYGDLTRYISDIATVLIENRRTLREIGFSVSQKKQEELRQVDRGIDNERGYYYDEEEDGWEGFADQYFKEIWHKLCARYVRKAIRFPGASESSYEKLRIESLILGEWFSMFPDPSVEPDGKDMVAMALDLTCLKKLKWINMEINNYAEHTYEIQSCNREWTKLAICDNLVDIEVETVMQDIVIDFLSKRGPDAKPIERFIGYGFESLEVLRVDWVEPDYMPWILTDSLKEFVMQVPNYKMHLLKNAPNLERVFIEVRGIEELDFYDEELDKSEQALGNVLRHFLPLKKLRSMGFRGDENDLEPDEYHSYILAQLSEGHWKDLEEVHVVHSSSQGPMTVVRDCNGSVTLIQQTNRARMSWYTTPWWYV